jgi:uncharacterized membrane protein AbrB (regulator of aidB expression)
MDVQYNPLVAWAFVVLGVLSIVLSGWLLSLGAFSVGLVLGPLWLFIGVRYFRRTYFWVSTSTASTDTVTVGALVGSRERKYFLTNSENLVVEKGRLRIVDPTGRRRRVPVSRWMAHPADWRALTIRHGRQR